MSSEQVDKNVWKKESGKRISQILFLDDHLSKRDVLSHTFRQLTGAPILSLRKVSSNDSVLGLQQGGLSRFTPTRLCDSQVLLIQDLF